MQAILEKLKGGDRRSIGRVDEVVAQVLEDPSLFAALFSGLLEADPLVSMRAADALEKITARHPDSLQPYKETLIREIAKIDRPEVRWHVAQMLPRLQVTREEREILLDILLGYLKDRSRIVKTFAMQALADLLAADPSLAPRIIPLLHELTDTGSPAMRARGRRLLEKFLKGNRGAEI